IMKQNLLSLIITGLIVNPVFLCGLSAQNASPFYQAMRPLKGAPKPEIKENMPSDLTALLAKAVEDTTKRTLYSSSYITPDGQYVALYGYTPVNYPNKQGKFVPIKIKLKSCPNGWVADQQPYPCYFYLNRSTGISLDNGGELKYNENSKVNGIEYSQELVSVCNNEVKLNLSEDIHKRIKYLTNGIETDYTIDKPIGKSIEFSENIEFPKGSILKPDEKQGRRVNGMWKGNYVLLSSSGKVISNFGAPLCYDASGTNWCIGYYKDEVKDGKHVLYTVVPDAWLEKAKYPITIDPVVIGPRTWWPMNRNIASNSYPKFNKDSLLVEIPGGITITHLYISYSFETNVNHYVPFKYGRIYFKTPCDSTPQLSCDTTNLPGYCYVDTTANKNDFGPNSPYFKSQLTCCFSPKCSMQYFYFLVGLSRDCPPSAPCLPTGLDSTNFIWTTTYPTVPFWAYIVGNTDQVNSWSVTPTKVCSNQCSLNMNVIAEYGVPPYTVTHPWAVGKTVFGYASGCNQSNGDTNITLTIPGCPTICGTTTTLNVPPPVVYDVCGDTVKGLTAKAITINPVPKITTVPDSITVCAGTPINLTISSCVAGTTINWKGSDKTSGNTGSISEISVDTTGVPITITYTATSSYAGCVGDTSKSYVKVIPSPTTTAGRDTTIYPGNPVNLYATGGGTYAWFPPDGLSCTTCPNPTATPSVTTIYVATISNSFGCAKEDTVIVTVLDQAVIIPNVFTPNADGRNDDFVIQNLEYYPNSQLVVYNRWGEKVYSSDNYQNEWTGGTQNDGVYYYILTLSNGKKYKGYVDLIK
ncbi:MAG TPA: gliding motility-associated C-terminal domain-containing protein, partial [Bacteroidia bacterium]|nr:gliding motility-associated C-terminal domain-containing protein [Bacteroidia bacterium]